MSPDKLIDLVLINLAFSALACYAAACYIVFLSERDFLKPFQLHYFAWFSACFFALYAVRSPAEGPISFAASLVVSVVWAAYLLPRNLQIKQAYSAIVISVSNHRFARPTISIVKRYTGGQVRDDRYLWAGDTYFLLAERVKNFKDLRDIAAAIVKIYKGQDELSPAENLIMSILQKISEGQQLSLSPLSLRILITDWPNLRFFDRIKYASSSFPLLFQKAAFTNEMQPFIVLSSIQFLALRWSYAFAQKSTKKYLFVLEHLAGDQHSELRVQLIDLLIDGDYVVSSDKLIKVTEDVWVKYIKNLSADMTGIKKGQLSEYVNALLAWHKKLLGHVELSNDELDEVIKETEAILHAEKIYPDKFSLMVTRTSYDPENLALAPELLEERLAQLFQMLPPGLLRINTSKLELFCGDGKNR